MNTKSWCRKTCYVTKSKHLVYFLCRLMTKNLLTTAWFFTKFRYRKQASENFLFPNRSVFYSGIMVERWQLIKFLTDLFCAASNYFVFVVQDFIRKFLRPYWRLTKILRIAKNFLSLLNESIASSRWAYNGKPFWAQTLRPSLMCLRMWINLPYHSCFVLPLQPTWTVQPSLRHFVPACF